MNPSVGVFKTCLLLKLDSSHHNLAQSCDTDYKRLFPIFTKKRRKNENEIIKKKKKESEKQRILLRRFLKVPTQCLSREWSPSKYSPSVLTLSPWTHITYSARTKIES